MPAWARIGLVCYVHYEVARVPAGSGACKWIRHADVGVDIKCYSFLVPLIRIVLTYRVIRIYSLSRVSIGSVKVEPAFIIKRISCGSINMRRRGAIRNIHLIAKISKLISVVN